MKSRRLIRVETTRDMISSLCWDTGEQCIIFGVQGIPKDAILVGVNWDHSCDMFNLVFQHHSFEEVPVGFPIPVKNIIYTKYYV